MLPVKRPIFEKNIFQGVSLGNFEQLEWGGPYRFLNIFTTLLPYSGINQHIWSNYGIMSKYVCNIT